ncbi:transpeptidase involved in peptidoglycan synthesis (penicillin-binding protein 2) [Candidatus Methylobacter favarea]|uniref:Peptidoglycan D,D-transpeptidase MrdA n=1 Tax=Candidatus Methylobacter favarea TaxID=2707345 RepID=A0A8S0WYY7_9GAMM|nr:penicillin-binding protein 2 [Candidatus Methylobacter favarea]CAA9889853.1 transpeptidase involved in peptidoglycan synthesis (penicillin-binding protein 2) [Candidatus Methylobacter favarea]
MSRIYTIKDNLVENRLFLNRIAAAFITILLLTSGLVIRLIYLQIVGHEHYATLAKENSIKIEPLEPTRGIIYDRHGKILAENLPSYSLELIPEQISNMDDTLRRLQNLLAIPNEKIEQYHKQRIRQKRFTSTPLLISMSDEEVAKFAVVRPYFPGVDIHARLVRHYPYKDLASHVVGYVGRINEAELKTLPIAEYRGANHVGKIGIEGFYETELHGKAGYAEIETNVQARAINILNEVDTEPGANLYLTLDIDLQKTAYDALDTFNGAVVAIEIKTGGVLVFASRPGFDPNPFVVGITNNDYQALQASDNQPLYNRALRGLYPPGSSIKPFIALAGLEYNVISVQHRLFCPGYYQLPNASHRYRDWKKGGHGAVSLTEAITQSCDVYFYTLASMLGIDRIHSFLQQFGFGEKSGIDLVGERSGLLPSREWKRNQRNQSWYPGETVITGIGQGFLQISPLQLARATATLANKGNVVTPFLVDKIVRMNSIAPGPESHGKTIPLNPVNANNIIQGMINVVHSARGTAKGISKDIPYQIAGKTGTAQVFNIKQDAKYNEKDIEFKLRDHALFISFAPADDPKIAVAVIVENGGHGGSVAAPIAGKVIRQFLGDKK